MHTAFHFLESPRSLLFVSQSYRCNVRRRERKSFGGLPTEVTVWLLYATRTMSVSSSEPKPAHTSTKFAGTLSVHGYGMRHNLEYPHQYMSFICSEARWPLSLLNFFLPYVETADFAVAKHPHYSPPTIPQPP